MRKLPTQFHCLHTKRVLVKIQWPKQSATWLLCFICLVWILWKVDVDVKFVSPIVWLHLPPQSLNCWADATTVVERIEDWPWVKMEFLYCADTAVARVLSMPGVVLLALVIGPLLFMFNCIPCSLLLIEMEE